MKKQWPSQELKEALEESMHGPKPDTILKQGDWELRLSYHAVGTRSEYQDGTLMYKGKQIGVKELGEEKETDLGRVKYYGERPWMISASRTGWHLCR